MDGARKFTVHPKMLSKPSEATYLHPAPTCLQCIEFYAAAAAEHGALAQYCLFARWRGVFDERIEGSDIYGWQLILMSPGRTRESTTET